MNASIAGEAQLAEIETLARGLARLRSADAADRVNPLYLRHPEAWLESQVRTSASRLDAGIRDAPSTARPRNSPPALAAFWICWPWTTRAAWW